MSAFTTVPNEVISEMKSLVIEIKSLDEMETCFGRLTLEETKRKKQIVSLNQ